ncbi:MAG: peptidase M42 family [Erysipelotrichaceae bacterium]|nr:MAG: peptidase M42 [Erysipelotrichaceae bacterium]TXT16666.1 MAG: peptidase M42 family [Erysipelotrichaceae bacterium]
MEENKKVVKIEEAYGKVDLKMMEDFTSADGISGCEKEASRVMKSYVEPFADEITYDNLGSLIALKKGTGKGPKVMLMGHIDEIGFVVRSIEEKGFIRLAPVGGWWGHVLLSHPVTITTRSNQKYVGVIGSKPPHGLPADVRSKVMEVKDLFVDLGVKSKEEVELLGIRPGDMVSPKSEFTVLANPNYLMAKAWDDRVGALIATEVLMNLKGVKHQADVYAVGTVQEEVGLRGSKTATYAVHPDLGIALDVTVANDIPGTEPGTKMGVGITLAVQDSSHLGHRGLLSYMSDLAKELKLDVQYDTLLAGGTDSGENHKSFDGIINCTLSIPSRYIHSHRALIHRKDYVDTVTLMTEFVKRVDWDLIESLRSANR